MFANRRQRGQVHAMDEGCVEPGARDQRMGGLERQPCLAYTAGPGDRQQAATRLAQARDHLRTLGIAPNERRERRRQIVQRARRGIVVGLLKGWLIHEGFPSVTGLTKDDRRYSSPSYRLSSSAYCARTAS